MQTAIPHSEQTVGQKVSAFAAAVCVVDLTLFCGLGSARFINQPFPGFLVLENGVIPSSSLSHWPAAVHAESLYQHVVVAVNGQVVTSGQEVYTIVTQLPLGSLVTYRLEKDGEVSQVTFPSLLFGIYDYISLQGMFLFTGLVIVAIGLVVWFLQPTVPASQALFLQCGTLGLYILTAADLM